MKVSVIIPIYKAAQYIEACVQSVVDQTHKDIELILVDDKSPDDSLALAKKVLVQHDFRNAIIIEQPRNRGVSEARNTGLAVATGEFVLFVDSDDTMEPTMLAEMTDLAGQHNVDIVVCNAWRINATGATPRESWHYAFTGLVASATAVQAILDFKERKAYIWTNLYRKSLFDNIKFTKNVYYEDSIIQPVLWKEARQLYFHPRHLYNYFERSGSITTKLGDITQYLDIPDSYREMERNFFEDPRVDEHLRSSLLLFNYTWIRNLTLTIISANLPYSKVAEALKRYSQYVRLSDVLKMSTGPNRRLAMFLAILKISPYLYWKRFSTNLLAS